MFEMARPKVELKTYFGQCKCCLNYAYLKNMWEQHMSEGEGVIYGKMLVDCFCLSWIIQGEVEDDKICDGCISRLREAFRFKRQVLQSRGKLEKANKVAPVNTEVEVENIIVNPDIVADDEKDYEDVEFLEEDSSDDGDKQNIHQVKAANVKEEISGYDNNDDNDMDNVDKEDDDPDPQPETRKLERPQALTRSLRNKKKYTEEELKMDSAVKSKELNIKQAAGKFNFPRKMSWKIKNIHESKETNAAHVKEMSEHDDNASDDNDTDYVDNEDDDPDSQPDTKKRKRPQALTKRLRNKNIYRQYTEEELNKALAAVKTKELNIKQAAEKYNVPRKTVSWKIKNINENRETNAAQVKEMSGYDDNDSDDNDNVDKEDDVPDSQPDTKKRKRPQALTRSSEAVKSKVLNINQAAEKDNFPRKRVAWKIKNLNENRETNAAHVKEMLGHDNNVSDDNDADFVDKEDDDPDSQPDTKKRKRPKALPMSLRNKRYRQYTEEELKLALEAVKLEVLSVTEAAEKYNVPRKTLALKIRHINENREAIDNPQRKKISEFIRGIQTILTHTNATPFKNYGNKYYCLFCPVDTPHIEDPKELRIHTHSKHTDKVKRIEFLMRPNYINEMIRFDVENLTCKCDTKATWHEMLDHLQTKHDVNIEELRKRVVPYRLTTSEMTCAFCDYSSSFTNIDTHMNTHYKNHICGNCGDTFITAARLQRHVKVHTIGIYPCNSCDKMFSRELYRKKHIDVVHMKKLMYGCIHCDERFSSDKLRFVHMESEHKDKLEIKSRTCKECDKTFPWGMEYAQHMRRFHGLGAHTCDECGKEFRERKLLENHKVKHTGVKKYECDVCQKPYFSKTAVLMHKKNKHSKPEHSE